MNLEEYLKKVYVVIPMLQREYVQGMDKKGEIFVKKIFETLTKSDSEMVLDIVFDVKKGDVENDDGKIFDVVAPIDGQQRLTTLYLLYYYVGSREGKKEEDISFLERFSYETRDSSTNFCKEFGTFMDAIKKGIGNNKPSEIIRNHVKYRVEYELDYTINSMLSMLDIIHEEYNKFAGKDEDGKCKKIFDKLGKIQFDQFSLEEYNLGDKLYVIMNDRGKLLSSFENLKSSLIDWMRKTSEFNVDSEFSIKLDTTWGNDIWNRLGQQEKETDTLMYKLFCRYFLELCMENEDKIKENDKDLYDVLFEYFRKEDEKKYEFEIFKKVLDVCEIKPNQVFGDLESYYDSILNIQDNSDEANFGIPEWELEGKSEGKSEGKLEIQSRFIKKEVSFEDRALLYAYRIFKNSICHKTEFEDWKRFVWNMSENVVLSEDRALKLLIKILKKYKGIKEPINVYLSQKKVPEDDDYEKYEIRKAKWIVNKDGTINEAMYKQIKNAENHPFLKGDIDWLIKDENDTDDADQLAARYEVAKEVFFDQDGIRTGENNLVVRALLARTEKKTKSEKEAKKNKYKDIIIMMEKDGDNHHVIKTQMHDVWDNALKQYIIGNTAEGYNKEAVKAAMQEVIDKKNYTDWEEDQFWHEKLCESNDTFEWIKDKCKDANDNQLRATIKFQNNRFRIDVGTNANGRKIIYDPNMEKIKSTIEAEIRDNQNWKQDSSDIFTFKEVDNKLLFYFPGSEVKMSFKDMDDNECKDDSGNAMGFVIRPLTGVFESLKGSKFQDNSEEVISLIQTSAKSIGKEFKISMSYNSAD